MLNDLVLNKLNEKATSLAHDIYCWNGGYEKDINESWRSVI